MNREDCRDNERMAESAIKAHYANPAALQTASGLVGEGYEAKREGIRGRVYSGLSRCRQEARKTEQLEELSMLLDKHPDIARILELVEVLVP